MGWGSGTPAAHPYPKSWQVTPRPVQIFQYQKNLSIRHKVLKREVKYMYVLLNAYNSYRFKAYFHFPLPTILMLSFSVEI